MTTRSTLATRKQASPARRMLEKFAGPLTLGNLLAAIRQGEEESLAVFSAKLGISRAHLCDIEHGRKAVSVKRAALFAETLGYSQAQFVRLALQDLVDEAELHFTVRVNAA